MGRSLASIALALATLGAPSIAFAQLAPMFAAFGGHAANSNLQTHPIVPSECSLPIAFTFTPTVSSGAARYIDVWSAPTASANCQDGAVRANTTIPVCTYVGAYPYTTTTTSADVSITPMELFGSCTRATRTFYFFDSPARENNTDTFTTYWVLGAQLSTVSLVDASAPPDDAGAPDAGAPPATPASCACGLAARGGSSSSGVLALLVLAWVQTRRRRR
jgi:hypothetical protein